MRKLGGGGVVVVVALCLHLVLSQGRPNNECHGGLGLENGQISDSQIESSVSGNNSNSLASSGRLNNPSGAWCYTSRLFQAVSLTIDLGSVHLVTGFQSQGPPTKLYPAQYLMYVGLRVKLSVDGHGWKECCGEAPSLFYADDRADESDVVSSHSFHTAEAARFIRIDPVTNVRWIGDEEKCFRFEILGCSFNDSAVFEPQLNLTSESLAAGFLTTRWNPPEVILAGQELVQLKVQQYLINVTHNGDHQSITRTFNTSDTVLIVPNPLWGVEYHMDVVCAFQGQLIPCGGRSTKAMVEGVAESCFRHEAGCRISDHVLFALPNNLSSVSLTNGSTLVLWTEVKRGWRAPTMRLSVVDNSAGGSEVVGGEGGLGEGSVTVPNLQETRQYELRFTPGGQGVPIHAVGAAATLVVLLKEGERFSFIASVGLETFILWNGRIKAQWRPAKALMESSTAPSALNADGYTLSLSKLGEPKILQQINVSFSDTTSEFGGISLESSYLVSIMCLFGERSFDCGTSPIFSSTPLHTVHRGDSTFVYVETINPDSWTNLESFCSSSEGHLVSLTRPGLERALANKTQLSNYWCGGNMCPDSPAPTNSLWSSGSAQINYTNFAAVSELDGTHCCIKVALDSSGPKRMSQWKGEDCESILKGICEFKVADYIDALANVTGVASSPVSVNLSWTTGGDYWQPNNFHVRYCFVKSLSSALALPFLGDRCREERVLNGSMGLELSDLEPFSEYSVSVAGGLDAFVANTTLSTSTVRTLPKSDVDWIITPDGKLLVSWLKKIANFQEDEKVQLIMTDTADSNKTSEVSGTAAEVQVNQLELGHTYQLLLKDQNTNESYGPFHVTAYPNCSKGERTDLKCNYVSSRAYSFGEIGNECAGLAFGELNISNFDSQNLARTLRQYDFYWIGNRAHQDNNGTVERTSRIYQDNSTGSCEAWSPRSLSYTSAPCEQKLPIFCQSNLSIVTAAPKKTALSIKSGPTYVVLDWNDPHEGWLHTFSITTVLEEEKFSPEEESNRTRRQKEDEDGNSTVATNMTSIVTSHPPVNVTNLVPESKYSFIIKTTLSPEWVTTLLVDEVFTSANNSQLPANIIGLTAGEGEYRAAQLSIFSILIVIVASAILIFIISGTLSIYADNAVQVCFECCLLGFFISILLSVADGPLAYNPEKPTLCALSVAFLSFFSLAAFVFLFLESLIIANRLVDGIGSCCGSATEKIGWLIGIGFSAPFIYTLVVVPVAYKELIPNDHRVCWLNLSNPSAATFLVPITLLFTATLLLLLVAILASSDERASSYNLRTSTLYQTRYVILLITSLWGLGWALGVTSAHYEREELVVLFLVTHFFLALAILILRCLLDKQVRMRLKRFGKSNNELGEVYQTSRPGTAAFGKTGPRSAAPGGRRSIFSAQSRHSVISHNQVMPQTITPVENEQRIREADGNTSPQSRDPPMGVPCRHLPPFLDLCGWKHSKNAIWQELEQKSPNSLQNRKALRRFRRICSESYLPVLSSGTTSPEGGTTSSTSTTDSEQPPPAKYVSPFGEGDCREEPVVPGADGRMVSATADRRISVVIDEKQLFSLPNTPDTENPFRGDRMHLQLVPNIGEESYI